MIHAFVQAQFSDATTACTGDTALTQATASEW